MLQLGDGHYHEKQVTAYRQWRHTDISPTRMRVFLSVLEYLVMRFILIRAAGPVVSSIIQFVCVIVRMMCYGTCIAPRIRQFAANPFTKRKYGGYPGVLIGNGRS
jgi:hypothetical protein